MLNFNMRLHEAILASVRGNCSLEENENYPEGITPLRLSEISFLFGDISKFLFVPADLVPESETSMRIKNLNQDLNSKYVVYRWFRRGVGHDSSYG